MFFLYLASGLFLGWSLGANDAANVYGTAVGTRMIRFGTAAAACSIFVILGAVWSGAGASHTLGELGAVNALAGSFTVALAAAVTITWMTKLSLPVSTSQAVVGAIIGWNLFTGSLTDYGSLTKIVSSWVLCPILAGIFALVLFKVTQLVMRHSRMHLLRIDLFTRIGLFLVGTFASYSLGANNIANVMGVFVPSAPFQRLDVLGLFHLSAVQQLFLLGSAAIAVGVITYSKRVMLTVGNDLFRLSAIAALIVVLAQAIVLFLFSSMWLENWLIRHGLPTIPLVPVSSSQAVIGAIIGIGIAKAGRNIRFRVLGRIASGWVSTPIISGVISFVLLFFVQNVFSQEVVEPTTYKVSYELAVKLKDGRIYDENMDELLGRTYENAVALRNELRQRVHSGLPVNQIVELARVRPMRVDIERMRPYFDYEWFTEEQVTALFRLHGRTFTYGWQLHDALQQLSGSWRMKPPGKENKLHNKDLEQKLSRIYGIFELE